MRVRKGKGRDRKARKGWKGGGHILHNPKTVVNFSQYIPKTMLGAFGIYFDVNFNYIFWVGTLAFFIASIALWIGRKGDVGYLFYVQVIAVTLMFTGRKIGRAFLGLE